MTRLARLSGSIGTEVWSSVIVTIERKTFGATNVFSDRGIKTESVDDCSWIARDEAQQLMVLGIQPVRTTTSILQCQSNGIVQACQE